MLEELTTWWQNISPETQTLLKDGGVAVAALLGGHFLGVLVTRTLRGWEFDAALRPPGAETGPEANRGFTPTLVAGILVRLTIWVAAAWWLAHRHGQAELAATLSLALRRTWGVAVVLVTALGLGSVLSHRLLECLQALPKPGAAAAPHRNLAGAVAAGAYVLAVLLVLLIAADSFDWPLTRSAALSLWQFTQHLLAAGAALFVGGLGSRWVREVGTAEGLGAAEKKATHYTSLGIMGGTTVLAVAVLLSGAGVLIGLAALALLGLAAWLLRDYLPDVTAGWQLRSHKAQEVWFEGTPWQVAEVGFLTTQVGRAGEFHKVQNRLVLDALLRGAPSEAAAAR